jgi:YHS domain-containing protein
MQVQSTGRAFRYPVQFVPANNGQDYLAIPVDLTHVRDGDMKITFELANVPSDFEPSARFTQVFSMSRVPAAVTVVPLTENDRSLIEKQRVCPVMDAGLNEHGQPIKLMVGGQPVFVCCESCVEEVRKDPQKYVAKVATAIRAATQPTRPQAAVFWASDADAAAIEAQTICPVTKQPLGTHGRPLKVVVEGRPIFVCCQGCIAKVQQNPELYLSPVARGSFAGLNTREDIEVFDEPAEPTTNVRNSGGVRCSGNGCSCNSRR